MSQQSHKILLIEDEIPAAKRLKKLVLECCEGSQILDVLDSVEDAVEWFQNHPTPDVVFMDIQLADGLSFSIFSKVEVNCPVIFTTAYDQYAIQAFKVNSIDYLLKPIEKDALHAAWQQFLRWPDQKDSDLQNLLANFQQQLQKPKFKERFLVKLGEQYKYIYTKDIAYFRSESSISYLVNTHNVSMIIDEKMDEIERLLNPSKFFRINRKYIIHIDAIDKIHTYLNSRLKLELKPVCKDEVIVARERVNAFKEWLDS